MFSNVSGKGIIVTCISLQAMRIFSRGRRFVKRPGPNLDGTSACPTPVSPRLHPPFRPQRTLLYSSMQLAIFPTMRSLYRSPPYITLIRNMQSSCFISDGKRIMIITEHVHFFFFFFLICLLLNSTCAVLPLRQVHQSKTVDK